MELFECAVAPADMAEFAAILHCLLSDTRVPTRLVTCCNLTSNLTNGSQGPTRLITCCDLTSNLTSVRENQANWTLNVTSGGGVPCIVAGLLMRPVPMAGSKKVVSHY
jgi:hypothetical protein